MVIAPRNRHVQMEDSAMNDKTTRSDAEWRARLTADQYAVTRRGATEPAFSGEYHDCRDPGTYHCVCCGAPLFRSGDKFDSGSGWPSFTSPLEPGNLSTAADHSHGMHRVEVRCSACEAHLGHVFEDGPAPTGLRYCINSLSLALRKEAQGD
jgi:peptide-methionine (R)-S-oxide reductase